MYIFIQDYEFNHRISPLNVMMKALTRCSVSRGIFILR
ncbi:hypothetical protein JCM19231_2039 [Vibrio ishigakensis]|uniref:Uncharacterized protein n=1 Tax=Vibrio ishigakensis TaxID=1481914 RepID=A0A0B8NSP2_9VIBR|nr:hypothetical protein JCM19231_2039 [Vibrio ishigakensis]